MDWLYRQHEADVERSLLGAVSREVPWALVERFATLKRESGTEDERRAAEYIAGQLASFGIAHTVYEPELYISLPQEAELRIVSPHGETLPAKVPSFSASTSSAVVAEAVYIPGEYARGTADLLEAGVHSIPKDVGGKVVVTQGLSRPGAVLEFERLGAVGQIYINAGRKRAHETIVSSIWGTPTLESLARKPKTPVLNVSRTTGDRLQELFSKGEVRLRISTRIDEGWKACPLVVAEVPGRLAADEFVLLHGHYDSWHYGIGDNATGDAGLLELARMFHETRSSLRRTLRVAWWPAHSTGRYAGSTWFADQFAIDLRERCVAQVNMDSPGCRWATAYDEVMWMAEAEGLCKRVIQQVAGCEAKRQRPPRAGDYSFNNIGITGFFMLLSNIPHDLRREKGFHAVGGCGGNSDAWHTEDDLLDVADPEILLTDIRIYAAALFRVLESPLHPFDFRATVSELEADLADIRSGADGRFDLGPVLSDLDSLAADLDAFYARARRALEGALGLEAKFVAAGPFNAVQRELARHLVPLGYTKGPRFDHDPAMGIPPVAHLEEARRLGQIPPDSAEAKFLCNQLQRGKNAVRDALRASSRLVRACIES